MSGASSLPIAVLGIVWLCAAAANAAESGEMQFITIGTGGISGVYYPAGGAICRLVNKERQRHGLRCAVESTAGSIANLNAIRAGEFDLAIVQSDQQYNAYHGLGPFAEVGADANLRAVFSLHAEAFTVIARADSGIENFDDLKGKRVNVGNPGTGQRATMAMLMREKDWTLADFALAAELSPNDQVQALCDDKIDALVYVVGHPNQSVREATLACDSILIDVTGPAVESLLRDRAYYSRATIPAGFYRGNPEPVTTFALIATLVTSTAVPEAVVYQVVESVFEQLDTFRKLHPAFGQLQPAAMISEGHTAPLHAGAVRYYRAAGLLE